MIDNITNSMELAIKDSIIKFLKIVLSEIVSNSFWICLIVCMISLILYASGMKKAGKYCTISLVLYVVLEALGSTLL